jgi:hypothetical protein
MKEEAQNSVMRDLRKRSEGRMEKVNNVKSSKLYYSRNNITINNSRRIQWQGIWKNRACEQKITQRA